MNEELQVEKAEARVAQLGEEFGLHPEQRARFRSKASAWRGLLSALQTKGLFDEVAADVPPSVRVLMKHPPIGGVWMPAIAFQYVFKALNPRIDDAEMRDLARASILRGPMKVMKPLIEGTARLFGAKPQSFLGRTSMVMEGQLKGVTFEFSEIEGENTGENAASMRVDCELLRKPQRAFFTYWEGVFITVFDMCGINDFETKLELETNGHAATIHFRW